MPNGLPAKSSRLRADFVKEKAMHMRKTDGSKFQLLGYRPGRMKNPSRVVADGRRSRPQRRRHDPMLVLNISLFNFARGWNQAFSLVKAHENGAP